MWTEYKIVGPEKYRLGLIMGPNITCLAQILKNAYQAQSMYIGNPDKQVGGPNHLHRARARSTIVGLAYYI